MIAYKATYNFKCRNQEYKVGKTYTSDKLGICKHGLYFCQKMENVLEYHNPSKDFVLLEIEVLGKIETNGDKSVTNKFKVLRVIPFEEYTDSVKSRFTTCEYDEKSNLISEMHPDGSKYTYEYDEKNNRKSMTYPSGTKCIYEYDDRNNMISETYSHGKRYTFEYDDRNNMISETPSHGKNYTFEYDDRNNKISTTSYPEGKKYTYEYDERNNKISTTYSNGVKITYAPAVITEE